MIENLFYSLFFLSVGSLLNVFIHRLPKMMLQNENEQINNNPMFNLFWPPSHCPQCNHRIRLIDNIPVLSYLFLLGKCHFCKCRISIQYPIVELITLALSWVVIFNFEWDYHIIYILLFTWIGIAIFFIDLNTQLIPDSLSISLLWIGLLVNTSDRFTYVDNAILGAMIGYLSLYLFIYMYYAITGKMGMGHGDFKLFAAFGAWFGYDALLPIIMLSAFSGAIIGVIYLLLTKQNKNTTIPFGPFLIISGFIYLYWGKNLLSILF